MEYRNDKLRALCASLEAEVEAELAPKVEEYKALEARWREIDGRMGYLQDSLNLAMGKKQKEAKDIEKIRGLQFDIGQLSGEHAELGAKVASLRRYVYHARLVVLNRLREKVASEAMKETGLASFPHVGDVGPRPAWEPVVHHIKNLDELQALMLSPYIRQPETLERLQEIIRAYQQLELGEIVVRICDIRRGKPGIVWEYEKVENARRPA